MHKNAYGLLASSQGGMPNLEERNRFDYSWGKKALGKVLHLFSCLSVRYRSWWRVKFSLSPFALTNG